MSGKISLTVYIDENLLEEATALGVEIGNACESGIKEAVRTERLLKDFDEVKEE